MQLVNLCLLNMEFYCKCVSLLITLIKMNMILKKCFELSLHFVSFEAVVSVMKSFPELFRQNCRFIYNLITPHCKLLKNTEKFNILNKSKSLGYVYVSNFRIHQFFLGQINPICDMGFFQSELIYLKKNAGLHSLYHCGRQSYFILFEPNENDERVQTSSLNSELLQNIQNEYDL